MTETFSQSLEQMAADNAALTEAYWDFVKTEYPYFDGYRATLRTDHYKGGMWQTEDMKKALVLFEANEYKKGIASLVEFEKKYGDGDKFMQTYDNTFQMQLKALTSAESDRLKRIKIELDFKNAHQLPMTHYFKYKEKADKFKLFKEEVAEDIYNHALLYNEKIGKYNKEVIHEEMRKLFNFALWLNPNHAGSKTALSTLN